jgi:hypothetical protein
MLFGLGLFYIFFCFGSAVLQIGTNPPSSLQNAMNGFAGRVLLAAQVRSLVCEPTQPKDAYFSLLAIQSLIHPYIHPPPPPPANIHTDRVTPAPSSPSCFRACARAWRARSQ